MRLSIIILIVCAALLPAAGCGSEDGGDDERAATTPAGGQPTTTDEASEPATGTSEVDASLSPEGRAVLAASQDLAADVSETAEDFVRGRIEADEAMARLALQRERADELRRRAGRLPVADRARQRLVSMNAQISSSARVISDLTSRGRSASRDAIDERTTQLARQARSTLDELGGQLDERTREQLREALERVG